MPNARHITLPRGFLAAGVQCGIKESGREDLALIVAEAPAAAAAVTTSNQIVGAPVLWCRRVLPRGLGRVRGHIRERPLVRGVHVDLDVIPGHLHEGRQEVYLPLAPVDPWQGLAGGRPQAAAVRPRVRPADVGAGNVQVCGGFHHGAPGVDYRIR